MNVSFIKRPANIDESVMPGEKAVIYKRFGGGLDKEKVIDQGFHLKMPWDNKYIYDVRIQEEIVKKK